MESGQEVACAPQRLTGKFILREVIEILVLMSVGVLMTWFGLTCRACFDDTREFWIVASFTGLMWVLLWKGNVYIADYLSLKISWIDFPLKRLSAAVLSTVVYTFSAMYGLGMIYHLSFGMNFTPGIIYSVIITLVISLVMHGRAFLINWKESAIQAEALKKENIAARYESLKNQVNPHFLFNSLNALTNLVYEDQEQAVKFIKQLSEVYRYVLDTRDKEVVPLHEEVTFLNSYFFLQRIRFGDKLILQAELPANQEIYLPPLALQMLIENAIKHNVVSEDDPLQVSLKYEDGYLIVENNLNKRTSSMEPSAGVGLDNIRKRYAFLNSRPVEIIKNETSFIVKLPILSAPE
ncbi:MAG TPA: histidine kinase [Chryseosolibacter sp.]|nr:histidine kinase [Chryseosolibacter sp.]